MENLDPLVSICMPAFNAEKYIAEAIKSVIKQTYQNWELVIVNDGSTDNTLHEINQFSDGRIKVYSQCNKGQCAAANRAFEFSKGQFIKFFDSDDLLSDNMIAQQVKAINNNIDSVGSSGWGRFYKNDLDTFKLNPEIVWQNLSGHEWLVEAWKIGTPMMQCGLWLIPRNIILKAGLWDERLSLINDFDFFTRILINAKSVIFADDTILFYRSGIKSSLSATKSRAGYESAYLSLEKGITNLLSIRTDVAAQKACANLWALFIYEIYPNHPDLAAKAGEHLSLLPSPTVGFPAGGLSKALLPLLGWKTVKRLQRVKSKLLH